MRRDLEAKLDAKKIVKEAGMVSAPEYYSGRGAIASDVNDRILEKVYHGVQREYGTQAADSFAQMVADVPKLSATDFLLTIYQLERHDWKWDKKLLGNEKGIYVDGRTDQEKMDVGFATIACALSGDSSRDETEYIRREFLKRHGIKTPQSTRRTGFFY